jgi:dimethylaniline monooxygenase (N-oxide forming)
MVHLAVIGAGASGLSAIKNAIDYGCDVTAFEQSNLVGGLWNYTDCTDKDEYGIDVHSSMYKNLMTNLPIEVMCYPNEPFNERNESFVSSDVVLNYYQSYTLKYNLHRYISFLHQVIRVRPLDDNKWEVIVRDLQSDEFKTLNFDAIFICTGSYHTSYTPKFNGHDKFKGKQMHSHTYRCPNIFTNEKVLIVGGNNSAVDLVIDCSNVSKVPTLWSHHIQRKLDLSQFESQVIEKPDILELKENGVKFVDESFEECSLIVYATGYLYSYPFLTVDSGITAGDYVRPLWMHCLSINTPTLAFIGLPNLVCPNQMFQLQVQFCLTFITGRRPLPSKEEMLREYEDDMRERWRKGLSSRKGHFMGPDSSVQQNYYRSLSEKAGICGISPYILNIHSHTHGNRIKHFTKYRNVKYHIIDEENFKVTLLDV